MKKCPCGKIPNKLIIIGSNQKWSLCCGDCCENWFIEFYSDYLNDNDPKLKEIAEKAWNETPRQS